MKNGFLIFLCLFLTSCVSGRDYTEQKFFIDSNIAADVYCDGRYIGTTPLELDTSLKCDLKIEKEGYRPTSFKFQNLEKYASFPKDKISNRHGLLLETIEGVNEKTVMLIEESFDKFQRKGPFFIAELLLQLAAESVTIATEVALDALVLPVDMVNIATYASKNGSVSSENSSATSYNATSIDIVIPYDGDSFFFELLPKDKKTFNRQDLHELRTKLFVLKNFNELKFKSPEYVKALEFLVGKRTELPAPAMTPGDYFRILF